jgi:two-component system response regulator HydG
MSWRSTRRHGGCWAAHDGEILNRLCPSLFQGSACARNCEMHNSLYALMSLNMSEEKLVQDLVVQRPDGELVPLRMWAMVLPSDADFAYCAVVLRDRTQEVRLEEAASERLQLGGLVGHGAPMQDLFRQILRAAASEASVLITGESGTGKELVARALHDNSSRARGPYLRVHCAAFPEQLLESELFGHARGAFTGAAAAREGRFEAAHGGTLLLDEIGEVPLSVQVKLLRVLQEREIERLGENQTRKVDVRIIAATHRDLPAMVRNGEFRADLYYRLRVLPLHVPALRERREDIPLLVQPLLANHARSPPEARRPAIRRGARRAVRPRLAGQRQGTGERARICPGAGGRNDRAARIICRPKCGNSGQGSVDSSPPQAVQTPSSDLVQRYYRAPAGQEGKARETLEQALRESGGNRAEAARRLGMSRTTLWKRLKQYGLDDAPG